MSSKSFKYLSYTVIFLALILATIFRLFGYYNINMLFFMFPAVITSFYLKKMALKQSRMENRGSDYIEALEKEITTAKWVAISLFALVIVLAILKYS